MRTSSSPSAEASLLEAGRAHLDRVRAASDAFFRREADAVSHACRDMAARFHRHGRLLAFGDGAAGTDAYHVSVEFVHPVLVGRRALPALVLERDAPRELDLLARPGDIAMGISSGPRTAMVEEGLRAARDRDLLTVALEGEGAEGPAVEPVPVDHGFLVDHADPTVIQEVQETLYHVLWELVHVFFDHEELLE